MPTPLSTIGDQFSNSLAEVIAWIPLIMVLLTTLVVTLRYGFGIGTIAVQETIIYLHSAIFMLGASCTLAEDKHVRVDVFYRNFGIRTRAWINALGHVILTLPLSIIIALTSFSYVTESWAASERSPEPGGIPAVYLLKTLILAMAILLILQAIFEILKALSILTAPPLTPTTPITNTARPPKMESPRV